MIEPIETYNKTYHNCIIVDIGDDKPARDGYLPALNSDWEHLEMYGGHIWHKPTERLDASHKGYQLVSDKLKETVDMLGNPIDESTSARD